MPLSDHEQQLLDEMEQALYAEDPRFATQMKNVARRGSHARHAIGLLGVLVGLGLVLLGVNTTWVVGAAGFVVMVAALAFALTPRRTQLGTVGEDGTVKPAVKRGSGMPSAGRRERGGAKRGGGRAGNSFMSRMEERWERRRGGW